MRPHSLPADPRSFVGMARETAAMSPADSRGFTSVQMVPTHLLRTASRIVEVECILRTKEKRHLKVPELPS